MGAPGGGFDVRPDALRAAARGLRVDVDALDAGGSDASVAAQEAVHAGGALGRAASEFASRVDKATAAMRRSLEESADALEAAATDYATTDRANARGLLLPGLDGPGVPGTDGAGTGGAPPAVSIPGLAGLDPPPRDDPTGPAATGSGTSGPG